MVTQQLDSMGSANGFTLNGITDYTGGLIMN